MPLAQRNAELAGVGWLRRTFCQIQSAAPLLLDLAALGQLVRFSS